MKRVVSPFLLVICLFPFLMQAQLDKIVIPAGTPEDQALQAISNEPDAQKKLSMYEDFLQKFSSNPAAVAYGNWQISQYYQTAGDLPKALNYGDAALASSPRNLDILVSQANLAQQMKNDEKVVDYAARGGEIYNSLEKQPKLEGVSDEQFQSHVADAQASVKSSYEFLEAAAYNAIADESDAQKRMADIERFTPAFPKSRFEDGVASYAMVALQQLKDTPRLLAYGEKSLQANPHSLPTLLLMANAYVDDPQPGSVGKAISYSERVIEIAKADAPDADKSRKLSAGLAHSTLGYAYMKEDKTAASIPELKSACDLLRGQDDSSFSIAAYRLGFAYGKLKKIAEAKEILNEAVKIQGPVQQPAKELLDKVNAAKPRRPAK
jgi:tetratricopeptide (TPR) repeat protein